MFGTLLAIAALFAVLASVIAKVDGLAFLAPDTTKGITGSTAMYCAEACRLADGRCSLSGTVERAANCPLWKYVEANVPMTLYGSPFAHAS
jgi:hypothetical protein